jgi:hypothetical protein
VRAERHREAGAERVEVGRLTNRIYQDNADSLEQLRRAIKQLSGGGSGLEGDGVSLNNRLMDQLDEVCAACHLYTNTVNVDGSDGAVH